VSTATTDVEGARRALIAATCAPGLIWMADPDRRFEWFNPAWESYTGRTQDELRGERWLELVHTEDTERCRGILAASFQARQAYTLDYRLRRHDGQYRWILDSGVPRFEADGTWAGYVGTAIDIDERKQAEEQLAERVRTLRVADRRQDAFLSMLSHELRNPLAPIANAANVLRSLEDSQPVLVRLREILERQVDRLERLVENLIDATRSAQGHISLVSEPITVDSVVRGAAESSAGAVSQSGHTLDVRLPEGASLWVKGDLARLTQALSNVIVNAARYTHEAGVIELRAQALDDRIEISVTDRGQGMSPDFLPHAFELFAREEQATGHQRRGLGIGLTLARRIVQMHNGRIDAYSEGIGTGTRVVLTLPRIQPGPAGVASNAPAERYRVLIIEKDTAARAELREQMEMWGNEVRLAADAEAGLAETHAFHPHIVLCDPGLPGLARFDPHKLPRSEADGRRVFVAAVTGAGNAEDEARALAAGYDSVLVRPIEAESLAKLLRLYANLPSAIQ
jgi:PAS domain S-box-containing protein